MGSAAIPFVTEEASESSEEDMRDHARKDSGFLIIDTTERQTALESLG